MTTSVGFAEISTHILIENIIAEIKDQYLADACAVDNRLFRRQRFDDAVA